MVSGQAVRDTAGSNTIQTQAYLMQAYLNSETVLDLVDADTPLVTEF